MRLLLEVTYFGLCNGHFSIWAQCLSLVTMKLLYTFWYVCFLPTAPYEGHCAARWFNRCSRLQIGVISYQAPFSDCKLYWHVLTLPASISESGLAITHRQRHTHSLLSNFTFCMQGNSPEAENSSNVSYIHQWARQSTGTRIDRVPPRLARRLIRTEPQR